MAEVEGQVVEDEEERDAEDEARRRVALAQIRQYPDAVLRMQAREVERFDDDLLRLADRMAHLMHDARGVGRVRSRRADVLQRLKERPPALWYRGAAVTDVTATLRDHRLLGKVQPGGGVERVHVRADHRLEGGIGHDRRVGELVFRGGLFRRSCAGHGLLPRLCRRDYP